MKGAVGPYAIPDDKRRDHIPSTAPYTLVECVHDLLDVAARLLVMGGRLVFFYPIAVGENSADIFPDHGCFTLASHSEQILSTRYSRCLLTMEKTAKYTAEIAAQAREKHLEFRKNHAKLLEETRENGSLHSKVFSTTEDLELSLGFSGMNIKRDKDSKPKYRSKCV